MKIPKKRELQQIAANLLSDTDFKNFMKPYKDYTKDLYSFLLKDTTLSSDNLLRFRKNLWLLVGRLKPSIAESIWLT